MGGPRRASTGRRLHGAGPALLSAARDDEEGAHGMGTKHAAAAILAAWLCGATSAWGASCVDYDDLLALRTAAIQQQLMVAALTCHEIPRYNRFVVSHQSELIESDGRLKDYFVRRSAWHREAKYHLYKTELANAASLRSALRAGLFCAQSADAFDRAEAASSLAAFVTTQPIAVGGRFRACGEAGRALPTLVEPTPLHHRSRHRSGRAA